MLQRLGLAVLAAAPLAAQHSPIQRHLSAFEAKIAADVAKDGIGSISAAVALGDRILWAKGFGFADVAQLRPATATTIYRVGSISKSITAVLMACLAQDGELSYDDKVVSTFPALAQLDGSKERIDAVTFRRLASHTAGLAREPLLRNAASGPIANWEKKVVASLAKTKFQSAPGTRYSYSNIGYGVLGLALSRTNGKPFMEQVQTRIFEPLGMTSSTFILAAKQKNRLAAGYLLRGGKADGRVPAREHAGRGYKVPNGGVYATAGDLCRFAMALTGAAPKSILTAETRREVLRIQTPGDPDKGYGFGFSLRRLEGNVRSAGHGGSVAGYNAHLVFDPESKIVVAMLRNYNRGATSLRSASRELLAQLVAAVKTR